MDNSPLCWHCCHPFEVTPKITLPIKYDDRKDIYTTMGHFCSWRCAKAYALEMATHRKWEIISLLALMRLKMLGKYVSFFPAPKRCALKAFGGTMTIEEFRGCAEPPIVHFPQEKRYVVCVGPNVAQGPISKHNTSVDLIAGPKLMKDIQNSTTENNTLKLKRTKPLQRADSKLENILGIKRVNLHC